MKIDCSGTTRDGRSLNDVNSKPRNVNSKFIGQTARDIVPVTRVDALIEHYMKKHNVG